MIDAKEQEISFERGDIFYADLDEFVFTRNIASSVQRGIRPCVICQSDMGKGSPVVKVAPISASLKGRPYPFLQNIKLIEESQIHYEQEGTISRYQLREKIGRLTVEQIREMDMRLCIPLGITLSSILHINGVQIQASYRRGRETMFVGVIKMKFTEKRFRFSSVQFLDYFGLDYRPVLESGEVYLSEFLENLVGLKFLYQLLTDHEDSQTVHEGFNEEEKMTHR